MIQLYQYGKGLSVLCLHGWGFDHAIWDCLKPIWPSNWQMLTVDLPGHGLTPSMPMDLFTNNLLNILPQSFSIIGWSLGGLYAFHVANQGGRRINHLAAVATSPCFLKHNDWPGIEPAVLTRFYRRYAYDPIKTVHDFIELQFLNHSHRPIYQYAPALPTDAELGLTLLKEMDFRHHIQGYEGNVSFLLGKQDAIVPSSLANVLSGKLCVNDVSIINHCGHMPFLTHPDIFIDHMQERLT
ncbi:alpha/beta fold hydrolase [Legionella sp. W05-934-2]|uniref:alpha/beta fold hydrolase n=1 Tax=Legionella sp. W05-934-2 TaxID=1198649 RepID=UPI003461974B